MKIPRLNSRPFLMGAETEYAISGTESGVPISRHLAYESLRNEMRDRYAWLFDRRQNNGTFFQNGSRFYFDYGEHPEYATPECFHPQQLACHEKGGELLLRNAIRHVSERYPSRKITVLKNNVCPVSPSTVTWATHESYTCWANIDTAAKGLIPHVVTRLPYAGAGTLTDRFELSQRARHIETVTGKSTTFGRPLFCTRDDRPLDNTGGSWKRIHLLAKDSQRMPFGTYLTHGTTAVIFLLLNAGRRIGQGLEFADPVQAIHEVSIDPYLVTRLRMIDGRRMTALEIQMEYLQQCEREIGLIGFPRWTMGVLRHWRATLKALSDDPLSLANRLDAYCKLAIFERELRREGLSWGAVLGALGLCQKLSSQFSADVCDAVLSDRSEIQDMSRFDECESARQLVNPHGNPQRSKALRVAARLRYLDIHFHELGGLYDRLVERGVVDMVVIDEAQIRRATRKPPRGGRAELRSRHIRQKHGQPWLCDWQSIQTEKPSMRAYDLRDPFRPSGKLLIRQGSEDGPLFD